MLDLATGIEEQLVGAVATCFYDVVPLEYQTFCALTAQVARTALQRLGVAAELIACQLWYAAPGRNCVIGFVGHGGAGPKWDGHVICATPRQYIDAAVHHLQREFDVQVPRVIAGSRFNLPSQTIARFDLNATERVWWLHAPPNASAPPQEPPELVARLADALYARVQQRLAQS